MDVFDRFKNNQFLSPISSKTLQKIGNHCQLNNKSEILEIDCGKGAVSILLAHFFHSQLTGTENRTIFLQDAKRRALFEDVTHQVNFIESDINNLPFDEKFFNLSIYLSPPFPCETHKYLVKVAPFTVLNGWISISKTVIRDEKEFNLKEEFRNWIKNLNKNIELKTIEESIKCYEGLGFSVKKTFIEDKKSWEIFYSSQALTLLDIKSERNISLFEKKYFDEWKKELEMYHSGGGKESLEYVTFLMQKK
tara:strand:- start:664 stop:1413 length:750 start_codon:yes stop_codon:yes gene_type:complete